MGLDVAPGHGEMLAGIVAIGHVAAKIAVELPQKPGAATLNGGGQGGDAGSLAQHCPFLGPPSAATSRFS